MSRLFYDDIRLKQQSRISIMTVFGFWDNNEFQRTDKSTDRISWESGLIIQLSQLLPRVPADRPLEETPTSIAAWHPVMLSRSLVAADLAQRFAASVLFHFHRTCLQRKLT